MKIWLDDIRKPPDNSWKWYKKAVLAYYMIAIGIVTEISFDHDLGRGYTGYWLAKEIEKLAYHDKIRPIKWQIHSANPVGRKNITMAMTKADEFWRERANI